MRARLGSRINPEEKMFPRDGKTARASSRSRVSKQLILEFTQDDGTQTDGGGAPIVSDQEDGFLSTEIRRFRIEGEFISCEELVTRHIGLVKHILAKINGPLPANLDMNDLLQEGVIGLIEAGSRFEDDRGLKFSTFAMPRIFGRITDSLRAIDWAPRKVRGLQKQYDAVEHQLISELGRMPTQAEIAERMNLTREEFASASARIHRGHVISLDETIGGGGPDHAPSAVDRLEDKAEDFTKAIENREVKRRFYQLIDQLPVQERQVFYLYYIDKKLLKEIGALLNITASRASRVRIEAAERLRGLLRQHQEFFREHGFDVSSI